VAGERFGPGDDPSLHCNYISNWHYPDPEERRLPDRYRVVSRLDMLSIIISVNDLKRTFSPVPDQANPCPSWKYLFDDVKMAVQVPQTHVVIVVKERIDHMLLKPLEVRPRAPPSADGE
jgi:hypothetical protein